MSYLGNQPAANFASVTKDEFSGDGSTDAFTLSKAATTNGVAVFVENVRQEPTTAYAVSGTTLTFTAAPVSASGNNIYVLHHNAPASTANHPAGQDLTAVNGTLTGTLGVTGESTLTGDATLSRSNQSGTVRLNLENTGAGGSTDYSEIKFNSTAGSTVTSIVQHRNNSGMNIGTSTAHPLTLITSGNTAINVDAAGHVTKPLNSAFYCTGGAQSNFGIDSNQYFLEGDGSEVYDVNADLTLSDNVSFSPGDVRYFTAPVTAKYMFTFRTRLDSVLTSPAYIYIFLKTSNRNYTFDMFDPDFMDSTPNYYSVQGTVIADMDTGDTAYPIIYISGGSNTIDSASTEFSGILIG
jgi:hypothetical protein